MKKKGGKKALFWLSNKKISYAIKNDSKLFLAAEFDGPLLRDSIATTLA